MLTPRYYLLLAVLLCCLRATAQDTHYWTHKFGPRNTLLSGSDDATCTDNSAIINNVGGLGFVTDPNLSITTNAYAMDNSKFKDGAGQGLDMRSLQFNIIPLILSGVYKHKKFPKWTVGYVLVDKVRYNFTASQRFDGSLNVLDDAYSPGNEEFVSQVDVKNSLSEIWAGIAVAYKLNDHFAVGISNYGAYREHNFSLSYTARAIVNSGSPLLDVSTSNFLYNVSYYGVRNIFKIGATAKFKNIDAGISVIMPSFNMYTDAVMNSDLTGVNITVDEASGTRGNFVANDRQAGLKAKFRSPASVSAGVNMMLGKTRVYATAEYFLGVKPYIIVEPRANDFIRPKGITSIRSQALLSVSGGAKQVVNLAIGVEQPLFKQFRLLAGIRTDNSYFRKDVNDLGNDLNVTSINIYHSSLGVLMKRGKSDICVGVKASYGRGKSSQILNINQPYDNLLLMGDTQPTHYRYYSLSAILGYVHYIK